MTHQEFLDRLDEFVDQLLPEPEQRAMERHAQDCAPCRAAAAAARSLAEQTRALPRALALDADPWPRIESALRGARSHRASRVFVWLAAASLAACTGILWYERRATGHETAAGTPRRDEVFTALVSGLERECNGAGQSLQASYRVPAAGPQTAAAASTPALSSAVAILDQAIAETGAALAAAPDDAQLQVLLAARYRQKLALLGTALVRMDKV